jgi:integrase
VILRDDQVRGFAVRLTSGSVSFIAEKRVKGTVRRVTLGQHGMLSLETAREQARKILAEMEAKIDPRPRKAPTLAEVLDDYVSNRRLRPRTVASYRDNVRYYLKDWQDLPVSEITKELVLERYRQLGELVSNTSANHAMHVLRMLLYHAARTHKARHGTPLFEVNPVSEISRQHMWYRKKRRQGVVPEHKMGEWSLCSPTVQDFLLLVMTTGLRCREAGTLQWSDVDFEARTLTIASERTKNHREHKLPLTGCLMSLLRQRRSQCGDSPYVFPGNSDGHMDLNVCRITQKVGKQGACAFMVHDLRRSFVSLAANLGVPHHLTKRLLNHIGTRDDTDVPFSTILAQRPRGSSVNWVEFPVPG